MIHAGKIPFKSWKKFSKKNCKVANYDFFIKCNPDYMTFFFNGRQERICPKKNQTGAVDCTEFILLNLAFYLGTLKTLGTFHHMWHW